MDTKQKQAVFPSYFKTFNCIGGECEDTCCAGWYLPVDEATYKKYKKIKQPEMKRRLDKELVAKKGAVDSSCVAKIKLKNGKCAFLSKKGWCDLYTELGPTYLSESCTFYPRTANEINNKVEYSLTLSCPEAARKVLLNSEGIRFDQESDTKSNITISAIIKTEGQKGKKWQDYLESYRAIFIGLLQDRTLTLPKRLEALQMMGLEIEELVKRQDLKKVGSILNKKYIPAKGIGIFKEQAYNEIIAYLKIVAEGKKLHSVSYQQCILKIIEADMTYSVYEKAAQIYEDLFAKHLDYMLENYLVNYVYERCVPIDGKSPYDSIQRLIVYYQLIKLHLIGIIAVQGSIVESEIVSLIQGFTKVYDHGEDYINKILKMI